MTFICEEHEKDLNGEPAVCVQCVMDKMFMIEQAANRALDILQFIVLLAPDIGEHDTISGTIEELERALKPKRHSTP